MFQVPYLASISRIPFPVHIVSTLLVLLVCALSSSRTCWPLLLLPPLMLLPLFLSLSAGGSVCMKPSEADSECTGEGGQSLKLNQAARAGRGSRHKGSGRGWTLVSAAGGTTGILCIIVFISLLAGSFFFLFKKYGAALAIRGGSKKPAPVPAYYGKL
mmetsp:Transcript_72679/g.106532  ORF Transcript_72679/g.106532 Transcript_72679/m.106532 type:complete len:158 (+) Transcript_72679:152-625(+)